MQENPIRPPNGFWAGYNYKHALLEAQKYIQRALERKQVTALLLLNYIEAFDMVDSSILMRKLVHYGGRGWLYLGLTHISPIVYVISAMSWQRIFCL